MRMISNYILVGLSTGLISLVNARIDPSAAFEPEKPSFEYCVGTNCPEKNEELPSNDMINDEPQESTTFHCPSNESKLYEDPDDCHRYIICYEGKAKHQTCPEDMAYSQFAELCVAEQFVKTCSVEVYCDKDGLKGDPLNCKRYYHCIYGYPYHLFCANGTRFDPVSQTCSDAVPCLSDRYHNHTDVE